MLNSFIDDIRNFANIFLYTTQNIFQLIELRGQQNSTQHKIIIRDFNKGNIN